MESYPANTFFNNFTNLFNRTEKTDDEPVLSSFRSLSEKNTEYQNISIQKPYAIRFGQDSPVEQDLNAIDFSSQINSRTTSETEVVSEKTVQPTDECNNHNNLEQRSSLEKISESDAETHHYTNKDRNEVQIQEAYSDFFGMDLPVSLNQANLSSTSQGDERVVDYQADLLSEAFGQEYSSAALINTEPAQSYRSEDLSDCISKHISKGLPEVLETQKPLHMKKNEELYTESTYDIRSSDIDIPVSADAFSDQTDYFKSTLNSNLVKPAGEFGTRTKCTHSDTGNNKIHPKGELWSSSNPDTCNRCHVDSDRQSCLETEDQVIKIKSDQVSLKVEPVNPDSRNETQSGDEDKGTFMIDESDDLIQKEKENEKSVKNKDKMDLLQEESFSLGIPAAPENLEKPLNSENAARSSKRVTFFPDPMIEKPPQLPSIFSGLRGLIKETNDQQKKEGSTEQPKSPLLKPASVKRALFSEKNTKSVGKGSILEQLSQLLSFDTSKVGAKKPQDPIASPSLLPNSKVPEEELPPIEQIVEGPNVAASEESEMTNTETSFNAFKAFFTPKPARRNTSDQIDLDAVKRAFNPETIRAIFDRNSSKSPDKRDSFDNKSPESEERTPGRLQAVWPPPKSKDEEGKIKLKYTEAEHQAALLQLKRECKEELEALEADYKLQLYHLRTENEECAARLQAQFVDLTKAAKHSHGEFRDATVSTEDYATPRIFRTVCIQTDRETFIKPVETPELGKDIGPQPNVPGKLYLASISHCLSAKQQAEPPSLLQLPPPLPPLPPPSDSVRTTNPLLSLPGPCESYLKPQSDKCPALIQANGTPPPPPPPPPLLSISAGLPLTGEGLFKSKDRWQRKPRVEPVCPMKPLYWTRLQIQDSRNDTLWSMLEEPAIINTNEFAELFAKMASPAKRKPLAEAYNMATKAKKIIKVLDSKRSQAVGILISSLHLEMKDIQQAILMMDNSLVDLDAIEALYENRAQPEELAKIRKHYETSDEENVRLLDKPEQFLYKLSLIPQFSLRAKCIIFQSTFNDVVESIQRKANMVFHVCKGLLERDSVKEVLGLVLAFGNYMNGGSRHRGQADGFDLEILPKLKDVKSRDNRISLVDYIVSYYLHNFDENAGTKNSLFPLPEPEDVFLASQVKFEDLAKELRKLEKDLESCEKDVQRVWLTSSEEYIHPFKEKTEAFISSAQTEKIATEHHLINAQKSFHDLVQYFGMKPRTGEQKVQPSHVFLLWFEFCNDFKTRWKRENRAISNERLKEAQQSVRDITADKKVETRKVHTNGLVRD
ncbi:Formin [Bagarius yarrelli]|uniref:Formin n=1 Tax=Bagarius yarrelli TaxID=175774 RepID=A0A556TSJ3_BAGYA|nr:Formin [Bagarius yarrelli]